MQEHPKSKGGRPSKTVPKVGKVSKPERRSAGCLPAVSFFGGFRTPAPVPVDRSVAWTQTRKTNGFIEAIVNGLTEQAPDVL
jgi:hypothetical protein